MRSLYAMTQSTSDHDLRYSQDWLEHYAPTKPEWHRGVVWPDHIQVKWAQAWMDGDVRLNVALGRTDRDDDTSLFLDGMNSFTSVRRALAGELVLPDGPVERSRLSFHQQSMKVTMYHGTHEELRRLTFILNRGSPMAWAKEQLPR